ncbi:hypothetical protein D3C71_1225980 [compost metagenome]
MLAAPGHGTACINDVAFQRYDTVAVLASGGDSVRLLQILRNDDVAQQASDNTSIPVFIAYQLGAYAHEAVRSLDHAPVASADLAGTDDIERQKGRPAQLTLLQKGDCLA